MRWAQESGARGHGVDISEVFLGAARARADELGVAGNVTFERADAATYVAEPGGYHIASCMGATWIGGGLAGTIELMRPAVKAGGLLLVGEPFWVDPPPAGAYQALDCEPEEFTSLGGTLERFHAAETELVEMVLADGDDWDRYVAAQWWTLTLWLRGNPGAPSAADVRAFLDSARRSHLTYGRRYLGWGVFVLRPSR